MGDFSDDYGGYDMLGIYEDRENERIAQRAKLLTLPKQTGMIHIDRLEQWLDASLKERKQREWVGLTDEEIDALHMKVKVQLMGTFDTKDIYRAVEQALKDKNT